MRALPMLLALLALAVPAAPLFAQVADPEVKKGIQQVDDGEYDAAILTLDAAARRLAAAPARGKDLAEAYLYLGIAYLAKGHETTARNRFREAVKQARDLNLTPDKFAPRVIEEFERAREEEAKQAPPAKKSGGGGSKTLLYAGAGAAAAGAGVFVIASGGDEQVDDPNLYESREGVLTNTQSSQSIPFGPGGAGLWKAELFWKESPGADVKMIVFDGSTTVTVARLITSTSSIAEWQGEPNKLYTILIGVANAFAVPSTRFELNLQYPKP
jgi:tetratricopeptide (TPR) repeat protein